jgi:SAM-dependent methyltransferase
VAVPGCGRGHDARLLARRGYRVTAFDFAGAPVTEARRLAAAEGVEVAVERRDVFTLDREYPGAFDGVWEYTCFCAIDPARREEYGRVLHAILRPGGLLLACFYPLREGADGPPFPVSRRDIESALAGRFAVEREGPPVRSVERRQGLEWLVEARRL